MSRTNINDAKRMHNLPRRHDPAARSVEVQYTSATNGSELPVPISVSREPWHIIERESNEHETIDSDN